MRTVIVTCDTCGDDLTKGNTHRLMLLCEEIRYSRQSSIGVEVPPPIKRDFHFCNLRCLKNWPEGMSV